MEQVPSLESIHNASAFACHMYDLACKETDAKRRVRALQNADIAFQYAHNLRTRRMAWAKKRYEARMAGTLV